MMFVVLLAGLACCPFAFPTLWQRRWVKPVFVFLALYLAGGYMAGRHQVTSEVSTYR